MPTVRELMEQRPKKKRKKIVRGFALTPDSVHKLERIASSRHTTNRSYTMNCLIQEEYRRLVGRQGPRVPARVHEAAERVQDAVVDPILDLLSRTVQQRDITSDHHVEWVMRRVVLGLGLATEVVLDRVREEKVGAHHGREHGVEDS